VIELGVCIAVMFCCDWVANTSWSVLCIATLYNRRSIVHSNVEWLQYHISIQLYVYVPWNHLSNFHGTYLAGHGTFKLNHVASMLEQFCQILYIKLLAEIDCGKKLFITQWLFMLHPATCTVLRWEQFVTLGILWVEKHWFKVRASAIVYSQAIRNVLITDMPTFQMTRDRHFMVKLTPINE